MSLNTPAVEDGAPEWFRELSPPMAGHASFFQFGDSVSPNFRVHIRKLKPPRACAIRAFRFVKLRDSRQIMRQL